MSVLSTMNRLTNGDLSNLLSIPFRITVRTGTVTVQAKTRDFHSCASEAAPLLPSILLSTQPALPLLFHLELFSLHAGIHLALHRLSRHQHDHGEPRVVQA